MITRRRLIAGGIAGAAAAVASAWRTAEAKPPVFEVTHTEAEWKALLPPDAYQVLRKEATERPGSSPLLNEHRKGTFACLGCDNDLFSSATKFESGTGWPSFWAPIDKKAIIEKNDFSLGMARTAVMCSRCGGHQGHVFDDGPRPTGLRYCMNGAAMKFKPATT
jgi:peptide-methionine (R)-S-oxide reductase